MMMMMMTMTSYSDLGVCANFCDDILALFIMTVMIMMIPMMIAILVYDDNHDNHLGVCANFGDDVLALFICCCVNHLRSSN